MSIALSELAERLQAAVPPRADAPSAAEYTQYVRDALLQLSQDAPLVRTAVLSVEQGVATYDLPDDFLFLIDLESPSHPSGVKVTPAGLVPVPTVWQEQVEVLGAQITFMPTPVHSTERRYRYAARYTPDATDSYARLTQNGARIALLYARHLALSRQADAVAGDGWRYQIGDEMVDKTRQGDGLRGQAQAALDEYRRAVEAQKGYGLRGQAGAEATAWAF